MTRHATGGAGGEAGGVQDELPGFARNLARRAGELQLSRYGRPGEVREKAPKDMVTEVDLRCEELMVEDIERRYPEDSILSEERGGEISPAGRTWVLDPLDGTANFSRGNPLFGTSVSVIEEGNVTHTAVFIPLLGDLYHAAAGGGSWRESRGASTPLHVTGTRALGDAFVGSGSCFFGSNPDPRRSDVAKLFGFCWELRSLGSAAIRGAWTAAGHLDVSVGGRSDALWDCVPTVLLVLEAGGRVTDLAGKPWTFASDGLLATNGLLHDRVIETISERPS